MRDLKTYLSMALVLSTIWFGSLGTKYYMVWVLSRSIDRGESFVPGCVDIPLF